MGWRNLFQSSKEPEEHAPTQPSQTPAQQVIVELSPIALTGTTTHCADAIANLFISRRLTTGGMIETPGFLIRQPDNPADPNAVGIHVEGERIGYLPGFLAADLPLANHEVAQCQVQVWASRQASGLRAIGWVAASGQKIEWPHNRTNPPAVIPKAQNEERVAAVSAMVEEALQGDDPGRRAEFERGMVGKYHYLETVEPIKQLKREGRLEEALALCYGAIEGAERDRQGSTPAPWYTLQAAMIHRKLGQRDEEIAVLERWLKYCPRQHRKSSDAQVRLDKLRAKRK
jgi:hypothetical protein